METKADASIEEAIVNGEINDIGSLVKNALKTRDPEEVLKALIFGMEEVGDRFESKEYFVPEVLLSAHTMQKGLELLRPILFATGSRNKGKVLIGSVEGDVHDIGKNLVAMFLEGAGFEVHNLGRDVPAHIFAEKVQELKPDVVALSAMMSTTVERMHEVMKEFERLDIDDIKFVVGGAAASDAYAKKIGANGYASDASKAIRLFEEIIGAMREKYASA
ncbi:MAG: corrinoid protein [Candidatus Hydrothermarchaeales archaeon]